MTWRLDWQRYDERIASLEASTSAVLKAFSASTDDPYRAASRLLTEWRSLAGDLREFASQNESAISAPALTQLQSLAGEGLLTDTSVKGIEGLSAYLAIFTAFRGRIAFHLADSQSVAAAATERAFVHLQQSIVVDESLRSRWSDAFSKGETRCESLGAAHLMLHGIWSFKAHGVGARTDLVLQEALLDLASVERAANALVMTEWKKVSRPKDASRIAAEARMQADLYCKGILSSIELRYVRYVVLVSADRLPKVPDETIDGIVYRHVNIAIAPSAPSASI